MRFQRMFSRVRLGLEIQDDGIRLVKLTVLQKKYLLDEAIFAPIAKDIGGDREGYWEHIQQALMAIVIQHAWQGFKTAICLPADIVKMQIISLPINKSDTEIELEIRAALYKEQPGLRDALAIDFIRLSSSEVQYTAVKEAYMQQFVHCVNSAGLKVSIVDVNVYARARAHILENVCEHEYLACVGAAMREFPKW